MTEAEHNQIKVPLAAIPEHGVPAGRMAITFSTVDGRHSISAGWLQVGASAAKSSKTVKLLDGDLNVSLARNGEFLGLEMLRKPTGKECKVYFHWSHHVYEGPKVEEGHDHIPCLAFETLFEAWERYEKLIGAMNRYRLAPPDEQYARALFDLAVAAGVDPKEWTAKKLEEPACQ